MNSPKPFCTNPKKLKAFVLGCDPTAFDNKGSRLEFEYVFDLGNDKRYFSGAMKNLNLFGLSLDDIYVQNLIIDYQDEETGKNKEWERIATNSILDRRTEFDAIDSTKKTPVLLTSEMLYKVLLKPGTPRYKARQFYDLEVPVPIPSGLNLLARPLIPLYRHFRYKLSEHKNYLKHLQAIFYYA